MRITKSEFYTYGAFSNPNLYRRANKVGVWMYYRKAK